MLIFNMSFENELLSVINICRVCPFCFRGHSMRELKKIKNFEERKEFEKGQDVLTIDIMKKAKVFIRGEILIFVFEDPISVSLWKIDHIATDILILVHLERHTVAYLPRYHAISLIIKERALSLDT